MQTPLRSYWQLAHDLYVHGNPSRFAETCVELAAATADRQPLAQAQTFFADFGVLDDDNDKDTDSESVPPPDTTRIAERSTAPNAQDPEPVVDNNDDDGVVGGDDERYASSAPAPPLHSSSIEHWLRRLFEYIPQSVTAKLRYSDADPAHRFALEQQQQHQRAAWLEHERLTWLEFTYAENHYETVMGRQPTRFACDVRADAWRLLLDVVSGPCSEWKERYARRWHGPLVPYIVACANMTSDVLTDMGLRRDFATIQVDVPRADLLIKTESYQSLVRTVLAVYIFKHPTIGYIQSMSYIAAMFVNVLVIEPEIRRRRQTRKRPGAFEIDTPTTSLGHLQFCDVYSAFERFISEHQSLWVVVTPQLRSSLDVTKLQQRGTDALRLLSFADPALHEHLIAATENELIVSIKIAAWYETCFTDSMDWHDAVLMWDWLLVGLVAGRPFHNRVMTACVGCLIAHRRHLLTCSDSSAAAAAPCNSIAMLQRIDKLLNAKYNSDRKTPQAILRVCERLAALQTAEDYADTKWTQFRDALT
jgi:hypothetical protein